MLQHGVSPMEMRVAMFASDSRVRSLDKRETLVEWMARTRRTSSTS